MPQALGTKSRIVKSDDWQFVDDGLGKAVFASSPSGWTRTEFGPDEQASVFAALTEMDWLDDDAWRPDEVLAFLRRHGAITVRDRVEPERHRISPDGLIYRRDGSIPHPWEVLAEHGIFPAELVPQPADPRVFVDAAELASALLALRTGLLVAASVASGADDWRLRLDGQEPMLQAASMLSDRLRGLTITSGVDRGLSRVYSLFTLALSQDRLVVTPIPTDAGLRLVHRPESPRQALWLTLAATARLLDVPFPVSGVHRCDYAKCGKWFLREPKALRGHLRFCSDRCGKSYYATEATRKKRDELKEARKNTEQEGSRS